MKGKLVDKHAKSVRDGPQSVVKLVFSLPLSSWESSHVENNEMQTSLESISLNLLFFLHTLLSLSLIVIQYKHTHTHILLEIAYFAWCMKNQMMG